ncbi:MAG: hypothetical protein ABJA62_05060 [Luteimonas sp.]
MAPLAMPVLTPYLAMAGIGWIYYRRIRRSFGRQIWQPRRTTLRLVLLGVVSFGLIATAVFLPHAAWGIAGGGAVGALLGALALRHTHAEIVDGTRYYTPNPWIGGALSLLLIGRLAWRWGHGPFAAGATQASQASPLTLAVAATLMSYYLVNGIGLTLRMKQLKPLLAHSILPQPPA